ncbi:MAG: lipoate--protein ligase [Planctomycetaceae bacterium]
MALDEALLMAGVERGRCSVRMYRWSDPTVSLGYFQDPSELARAFPAGRELPVVRRLTGGGALLHHHEWTYACVVPRGHILSAEPIRIYEVVHQAMMELLYLKGVVCQLPRPVATQSSADFLCHTRRDRFDVVCQGHKILGSAQRRRRGCVLQHGSLLTRASEWAPSFLGVKDLYASIDDVVGLGGELGNRIASALGSAHILSQHDPQDLARASDLRNVSVNKFR